MAEEIQTENVAPQRRPIWKAPSVVLTILLCLSAFLWISWKCKFDNHINFLPARSQAEWIVFPTPPDAGLHQSPELVATFYRAFEIKKAPDYATISLLAFRGAAVVLNGQFVDLSKRDRADWKQPFIATAPKLKDGTNVIAVLVTNQLAWPALNLVLQSGDFVLRTDEKWQVSVEGSALRPARIASAAPVAGKGNSLAGGENSFEAISNSPVWLLILAIVSAIISIVATCDAVRNRFNNLSTNKQYLLLCAAAAALLTVLFVNNLRFLPSNAGFDSEEHLKYIDFILKNNALPLAKDGWEMFQPPLYYVIAAAALKVTGLSTATGAGLVVIRAIGLLILIGQAAFLLGILRLLFPTYPRKQIFGFVFGIALPAPVYLAHYVTNESLTALLVTAAVFVALYIWKHQKTSSVVYAVVGALVGFALLTKVTALLAAVVLLGAFVVQQIANRQCSPAFWIKTVGVAMLAAVVVCGWHYFRVWKEFGTPFVGNWDLSTGPVWWQQEGFHTRDYYLRFGRSLVAPFFSAFHSFGDSLYSTLWGDGLWGGRTSLAVRPPWNYDLMAIGYLLSLIPTLLIGVGVITTLHACFKHRRGELGLILALAGLTFFAMIHMTLRVPSYAQAKAFYGLVAVSALAVFAATGFDALSRGGRFLQFASCFLMVGWALNSYAAFWVRGSGLETKLVQTIALSERGANKEALDIISKLANQYPTNVHVRLRLAGQLDKMEQSQASQKEAEEALRLKPDSAEAHLLMASALTAAEKLSDAADHARRCTELAPENIIGWQNYCALLIQLGKNKEAIAAGRNGLAVVPDSAELHVNLAVALTRGRNIEEAIEHYSLATKVRPSLFEPHLQLAYWLTASGRLTEAIAQYQQAAKLRPDDLQPHNNLSQLYRRIGQTNEALAEAEAALRINSQSPEAHFNAAEGLLLLNETNKAAEHLETALRLKPQFPGAHYRLGLLLFRENKTKDGIDHWRTALEQKPEWPELCNELAWVLATHPDAAIRNGTEAVQLAERSVKAAGDENPALLDTLAAAYAEAGRFEDAVKTEQRVIELLSKIPQAAQQLPELKERLALFQKRQPYRQR